MQPHQIEEFLAREFSQVSGYSVARVDEGGVAMRLAVGDRHLRPGGTVSGPKEPVGEMGFAAYFTDTEGNVVGLWETAQPPA